MKQTIILGNIITMDEKRPTAKAALVKDGVFAYIGDADELKKLAGSGKRIAVFCYKTNCGDYYFLIIVRGIII